MWVSSILGNSIQAEWNYGVGKCELLFIKPADEEVRKWRESARVPFPYS